MPTGGKGLTCSPFFRSSYDLVKMLLLGCFMFSLYAAADATSQNRVNMVEKSGQMYTLKVWALLLH